MTEKKKGRKPGVTTRPPNETKSEKFVRLANQRLNKSLKTIKQIKNLSAGAYEYKPEQTDYIIKKLEDAVEDTKNSFSVEKNIPATEKIQIPV